MPYKIYSDCHIVNTYIPTSLNKPVSPDVLHTLSDTYLYTYSTNNIRLEAFEYRQPLHGLIF